LQSCKLLPSAFYFLSTGEYTVRIKRGARFSNRVSAFRFSSGNVQILELKTPMPLTRSESYQRGK
jgi:hypothetical protein